MSNTKPSVRVKCVQWATPSKEKIVMPQQTTYLGNPFTETGLMRFLGVGGSSDVNLDGVDFFPGKIGFGEVSVANQAAQNKNVPVFGSTGLSWGYGTLGVLVGVVVLTTYVVFKK